MPIKLILFISFLFMMSAAHAGPLMNRITQLQELQQKINTHCLNNPNRAQVQVVINGTTLTCSHLIVLANRLRTQLQEDVTELEESCEQDPPAQPQRLAADAAAVSRAAACRPVSTDAQCLPLYGCAVFTMANPLATLIGGAQRLAGNRRGCLAQGAGAAPGCLQNIVKGIFDSLWGLLSLVWDVGRAAVRSIGEWTGLVRRQERSSSERLMAAQQSGPGFIRRFISNPGQVMNQMISSMFNGIKDAAMNSYGCESWSGAPFVSRCLRPMTNWNCASCQQKLQLMCGVAGFAIGEIGTALLTGGLAAGAKFVARAAVAGVRAGARASRFSTLARGVVRTLPRPPPALTRATAEVSEAAVRTLSAAERNAIRAFNAIKNTPLSQAIARGARGEANTVAGRAAALFTLRPAALYLEALENAAALGFRSVDGALARTTGAATDAAEIARVADAARPDGLPDVTASVPPDAADVVTLTRTQVDELVGPAEINVSPRMVDGVDDLDVIPGTPVNPVAAVDNLPPPPPPQAAIVVGDTPVPVSVRPVSPVTSVTPEPVRIGPAPEIPAPVSGRVQPREITPELRRMAGLSDPDRVAEAGIVINRPLTSVEQEAILQAHRVGEGTGRGYFTYTAEEIAQKGFILREAGFSASDIRKLMQEGVTGSIPATSIPELNALQATARGLSRNTRGVADMRLRDLNYSRTMTPDQINQRLEEARGLYRRSGDSFASVARSPQGTAQDYLSAIDGYTRGGNIDEAARLVREAGSKVNLPDVRADVQRNLDAVIAQRADNPRNPELGAQEQNLRNLLARIEPTPSPRPVPAVSPTQRESDFLRAYADGKIRDLNYGTNTPQDIARLSSEAVTSFRSSGDGYAAVARTSRSADDYLRAMDSYARAYSPEARTMIDGAISAGARRSDIEARLQARITELRDLRAANPRNTEYGVQLSSYEDLLSQVRRPPPTPTPSPAAVRTPTPTPAPVPTPTPAPAQVTRTPVPPAPAAPLTAAPVRPRATITSNDYWPPERDPRTMRPVDRGPAERTFWRSLMGGNGEDAVTTARATARLTTGDRTERLNSIKELVQQSFFNRGTTFSERSMTLQQRRNLLQVMDEMGEKYTEGTSFGAAREFRSMRDSLNESITTMEAATPNP